MHCFRILDKIIVNLLIKLILAKTNVTKFDKPYILNLKFSYNLNVIVCFDTMLIKIVIKMSTHLYN